MLFPNSSGCLSYGKHPPYDEWARYESPTSAGLKTEAALRLQQTVTSALHIALDKHILFQSMVDSCVASASLLVFQSAGLQSWFRAVAQSDRIGSRISHHCKLYLMTRVLQSKASEWETTEQHIGGSNFKTRLCSVWNSKFCLIWASSRTTDDQI